MAKCPVAGCSSWKGDSGTPWFKISQYTYDGEWPSDKLAKNGFTHDVRIPANIAPGDYVSCKIQRNRRVLTGSIRSFATSKLLCTLLPSQWVPSSTLSAFSSQSLAEAP